MSNSLSWIEPWNEKKTRKISTRSFHYLSTKSKICPFFFLFLIKIRSSLTLSLSLSFSMSRWSPNKERERKKRGKGEISTRSFHWFPHRLFPRLSIPPLSWIRIRIRPKSLYFPGRRETFSRWLHHDAISFASRGGVISPPPPLGNIIILCNVKMCIGRASPPFFNGLSLHGVATRGIAAATFFRSATYIFVTVRALRLEHTRETVWSHRKEREEEDG